MKNDQTQIHLVQKKLSSHNKHISNYHISNKISSYLQTKASSLQKYPKNIINYIIFPSPIFRASPDLETSPEPDEPSLQRAMLRPGGRGSSWPRWPGSASPGCYSAAPWPGDVGQGMAASWESVMESVMESYGKLWKAMGTYGFS